MEQYQKQLTKMNYNFDVVRDVEAVTLDARTLSDDIEIYKSSQFQNVRIYGDRLNPLFNHKDIERALEVKDLHLRRDSNYVPGKHFVRMRIDTKGGKQEAIALTEQGLYEAIFTSKSAFANAFKDFVFVVLHRLRIEKVVSVEDAKEDLQDHRAEYEAHIERLKKAIEGRDSQIEDLHNSNTLNKMFAEKYDNDRTEYLWKLVGFEQTIKALRKAEVWDYEQKLDELLEEYGNPVYVYTVRPPKTLKEYVTPDDYDYNDPTDCGVDEDTSTFLGVYDKPPENGFEMGIIYTKKPNKANWVRDTLRTVGHWTVPKAKTDDVILRFGTDHGLEAYPNCFYTSFTDAKNYVRGMFLGLHMRPEDYPDTTSRDDDDPPASLL